MKNIKLTEEAIDFIKEFEGAFKGYGKIPGKYRDKLYLIYNEAFNDSKRPGTCGACQRQVLTALYKAYKKNQEADE